MTPSPTISPTTSQMTGIKYLRTTEDLHEKNQWQLTVYFFSITRMQDFNRFNLKQLKATNFTIIDQNNNISQSLIIKRLDLFDRLFKVDICDNDFSTRGNTVSRCLLACFLRHNIALASTTWITPYQRGWRIYTGNTNNSLGFGDYILLNHNNCWICYCVNNSVTLSIDTSGLYNNKPAFGHFSDTLADERVLEIINVDTIAPPFSHTTFRLHLISDIDPLRSELLTTKDTKNKINDPPVINYLNTEFNGFRQTMVDRFATAAPLWEITESADTLIAVLETLAYSADYYEYFQDAVGTEAYLGTARKRISVTRFARMLDYYVSQGCNSSSWIAISVAPDNTNIISIPQGTGFFTEFPGLPPDRLIYSSQEIEELTGNDLGVFESCSSLICSVSLNIIQYYTDGHVDYTLAKGSTDAYIQVSNETSTSVGLLRAGRTLLMEQVIDPISGDKETVDTYYRHCISITSITREINISTQEYSIYRITWDRSEALPFDLTINKVINDQIYSNMVIIRGNVIEANYGLTYSDPNHYYSQDTDGDQIKLKQKDITFSALRSPDLHSNTSVAQIQLHNQTEIWHATHDLFSAGPMDRVFEVEIDNEGYAYIRFGDGLNGKKPNTGIKFTACYRIGNGVKSNVGRNTLSYIISNTLSEGSIQNITNPLPAVGGTEPEAMEHAKVLAQNYNKTQARCVTEEDYRCFALQYQDVLQVHIRKQWSGSWFTILCYLQLNNNQRFDQHYQDNFLQHMDQFTLVGVDLSVQAPRWVALDIRLSVALTPGFTWTTVMRNLQEKFCGSSTTNTKGYFTAGNFSFGETVYLSNILQQGLSVTGVSTIEALQFNRFGSTTQMEKVPSAIYLHPDEIAVIANNPHQASQGIILFEPWQDYS